MYDVIAQIINHNYVTGDQMQQYIIYTCCACIIIFSVVFLDMVYRVFRSFWRS